MTSFDDADVGVFYARQQGKRPTLREIINAHPHLFMHQTWYESEPFVDAESQTIGSMPDFQQWSFDYVPCGSPKRGSAASLALLYTKNPTAEIWNNYMWTDDFDARKQRVYIGGKSNTGKLEIHRHLAISSRWGLPVWPAPVIRTTEML